MQQRGEIAVEIERPDDGKALQLKMDWRGLGKTLGKGLILLSYGNFATALTNLVDAADTIRGNPNRSAPPPVDVTSWHLSGLGRRACRPNRAGLSARASRR